MADGRRRRIFILDDDADLRDALADMFALFGAECLTLPSVAAMMQHASQVLASDVALLDVNLGEGEATGVDAHDWLRARAFTGDIVFLTGHARSLPEVARANSLGVRVLAKPAETADLRALVDSGATAS